MTLAKRKCGPDSAILLCVVSALLKSCIGLATHNIRPVDPVIQDVEPPVHHSTSTK
jgi:hypothetical protein